MSSESERRKSLIPQTSVSAYNLASAKVSVIFFSLGMFLCSACVLSRTTQMTTEIAHTRLAYQFGILLAVKVSDIFRYKKTGDYVAV